MILSLNTKDSYSCTFGQGFLMCPEYDFYVSPRLVPVLQCEVISKRNLDIFERTDNQHMEYPCLNYGV